MKSDDETVEFWLGCDHSDLACRTAALHAQRRELAAQLLPERVAGARYALAAQFHSGNGVEVGAGTRPFPLPRGATAILGDIRGGEILNNYFESGTLMLRNDMILDAQTFAELESESQDFVISAHVIEHLADPIGSIESGMRVLRHGGHYVLAVPDKRFTFDELRPLTPLEHLLEDWEDGGNGTKLDAYLEHLRYVEPYFGKTPASEADLVTQAHAALANRIDIHFHVWTFESFQEMLVAIQAELGFEILAAVGYIVNESLFILRKIGGLQ